MRKLIFEGEAFDQFNNYLSIDKKLYKRIVKLIKEIRRTPFDGIGKPEPLKYKLTGYWSRRIDDKNRPVYKVNDNEIIIVACKNHYSK